VSQRIRKPTNLKMTTQNPFD